MLQTSVFLWYGTLVSQTQNTPMRFVLFLFLLSLAQTGNAQIINGSDTLYGNEWIDFSKTYYKIKVAADGIYRVPYATLQNAPEITSAPGSELRLYHNGEEVHLYVTTDGLFGANDFVEFYGRKNRGELDRYLFEDPETQQVNPEYSMFNDTSAYYLVRQPEGGAPLRIVGVANDLSNLPAKEAWCWYRVESSATVANTLQKHHIQGNSKFQYSFFDGEGWRFGQSGSFALKKRSSITGTSRISLVFGASDYQQNELQVLLNDTLVAEASFEDWSIVKRNVDVSNLILKESNNTIQINSTPGSSRFYSFISIQYPRLFEFENMGAVSFGLDASPLTQRYFEAAEFNAGNGTPVLFDRTNNLRLLTIVENNIVKAVLPPSVQPYLIEVVGEALITTVSNLTPIQFTNYSTTNAAYIIVSNKALFNDPQSNGTNWVQAYADYRSTPAGGGFSTVVVDVNELYEQFAWGQRFHPISIKNFLLFARKKWANTRFVFFIGKALNYHAFRTSVDQATFADSLFFVPMHGIHGSDMPYTMEGKGFSASFMACGRLAAVEPYEIKDYLEKVKDHELTLASANSDIASRLWMKKVLHNAGGRPDDQVYIRSYLAEMANTLETGRMGASVQTFFKSSNDPIQLSGFEKMREVIDSGVVLWTAFGHSAANYIDFDIGEPFAYNNKGKYPLMIFNGCYTGSCTNHGRGLGEQFVLAPNRGAIGYTAIAWIGYLDAMNEYSGEFYKYAANDGYGLTIGEQFQHTTNFMLDFQTAPSYVAAGHQFILQGDPAVRLHHFTGPDVTPDATSFSVSPNPVELEKNELDLTIDVANIGENTGGEMTVLIEQQFPDNSQVIRILDTIAVPAFTRQLNYKIPLDSSKAGLNRFLITLDPENSLAEQPATAEYNNSLRDFTGQEGIEVYFYADQVEPVYPPNYGIVGKNKVLVGATALGSTAISKKFLFEFDTLETFDSPWKKNTEIIQNGGLITWEPDVELQDSVVYYWRVTRDTLLNGELYWRTRSFVHLKNHEPGWNQSDFGQYRNNIFSLMSANDSSRTLNYSDDLGYLSLQVSYSRNYDNILFRPSRYPGFQNAYYEGDYGDYYWGGDRDEVHVIVIDPQTGRVVPAIAGGPYTTFKGDNSGPGQGLQERIYQFETKDSLERIKLMQLIDQIPDGFYVGILVMNNIFFANGNTIYTENTLGYAPRDWAKDSISFGKNLFQILEAQGAKDIRKTTQYLTSPPPYGLIFRKNHPEFAAIDTLIYSKDSTYQIRRDFPTQLATGQFETSPIGPATQWGSVHWKREDFDAQNESLRLSVYGQRPGASDTLLFKLTQTFDTALSFVSAQQFPYLKLRYEGQDSTLRTLPQPKYLRILYFSLPEGAMHPVEHEYFYADTLQQGDIIKASVAFRNVSDAPLDSLLVRYGIVGLDGQPGTILDKTLKPLVPGDTLHATFSYNTRLMNGPYQYSVFMNYGTAQPELRLDNNIYVHNFFVALDNRNPLLDVTFDGMHILDGDLISPKPIINVSLKDDNPFLALSDTTAFRLHVQLPNGVIKQVYFNEVMFMPAEVSDLPNKNTAKLEWRPEFTQDGEYRLLVNGRDASGNTSGSLDYTVSFKVINKFSISNLLNYPNPFSTNTCFVYTMTGAETPVRFKIQIMSVSGKVVKEITESEFGPLRPGTHRSDYCWDGRDNFGDQLANGVYLYRIVAKKADGSDFDFFENQSVDGYFKHGIGKMVLMR